MPILALIIQGILQNHQLFKGFYKITNYSRDFTKSRIIQGILQNRLLFEGFNKLTNFQKSMYHIDYWF